jgi:hypothetical protein
LVEVLVIVKLAANQPYLFPYIGYFQLIRAADVFVICDDLNYIRNSWINRNRILLDGKTRYFSVPIMDQSSFREIRETCVSPREYPRWRRKFFVSIQQAYQKAPHYATVRGVLAEIFTETVSTISELARSSILSVCGYLGINTQIRETSAIYGLRDANMTERVYEICKRECADAFVNAIGGTELYSRDDFLRQGISLEFLKTRNIGYKQWGQPFVSNLSIIDVMMFNSVFDIRTMLDQFELV